jgi:hypothetical protein
MLPFFQKLFILLLFYDLLRKYAAELELNMKLHYLDGRRYDDDVLVPTFELGVSWVYKISDTWSLALYAKGISNIFPWSQDNNWCGVGRELGSILNPIKTYEKVIFNPGISVIRSW